jgi:hypothetical protein
MLPLSDLFGCRTDGLMSDLVTACNFAKHLGTPAGKLHIKSFATPGLTTHRSSKSAQNA